MKILLIISIITGAITALVSYFNEPETQTTIEQIKDNNK